MSGSGTYGLTGAGGTYEIGASLVVGATHSIQFLEVIQQAVNVRSGRRRTQSRRGRCLPSRCRRSLLIEGGSGTYPPGQDPEPFRGTVPVLCHRRPRHESTRQPIPAEECLGQSRCAGLRSNYAMADRRGRYEPAQMPMYLPPSSTYCLIRLVTPLPRRTLSFCYA